MKKTIIAAGILTAAGLAGAQQLKAFAAENEGQTEIKNETVTDGTTTDTTGEMVSTNVTLPPVEAGDMDKNAAPQVTEPKAEDDGNVATNISSDAQEETPVFATMTAPAVTTLTAPAKAPALAKAPAITNGWNANKTSYYTNGVAVTGQRAIDGYWYLFDKDGKKLTGFQYLDLKLQPDGAKTCYYNAEGKMLYGQQYLDDPAKTGKYWYCFDLFTGAMFNKGETYLSTAYQPDGAKTVYYGNDGKIQYGIVNGKYYDTYSGAKQANKLITWKGNKYYVKANGAIHKGELLLNGNWKYFDENGIMKTSFVTLEKGKNGYTGPTKKVFYNASGNMLYGQQAINGYWYCFHYQTGAMFTGRTDLSTIYQPNGAKTVVYDSQGRMLYNTQIVNGQEVYLDAATGAMLKNGYHGKKYFDNNGYMVKGERLLNGNWKYFDENGIMKTGFVTLKQGVNGYKGPTKTVYYNASGNMVYGQQPINGNWYCFHKNTGAMFTGEQYLGTDYQPNGAKTVRYDNDGKMFKGLYTDPSTKKQKYYDTGTGALLKNGFVQIDGYRYIADGNGWITNKVTAKNLYGVDISNWQNSINVKNLDADFVIVKASEGIGFVDACFKKFADQTLAAGKQLGFYHFARENAGMAKQEAKFFYDTVKPYIGKGVPILDWETDKVLKMGTGWAKEFLDEFYRLSGVKPLVYTSANVTRDYNWKPVADAGYKLWVAQYATMNPVYGHQSDPWRDSYGTGAWSTPIMHQYTSTGHITGYNGNLDLNIFYGSIADWQSLAKINQKK